ncbi:MAG: hypothetical protein LC722_05300, partial [Actinobacteria bacterium]|nr:hypothetical protein [Actinomycetota bacterium]
LGMDETTLIAALLHDVVEDTPLALEPPTGDGPDPAVRLRVGLRLGGQEDPLDAGGSGGADHPFSR